MKELKDYFGEEGCCLTCTRRKKSKGCLCYDMKWKKCIYYIPLKYSPNYRKPHCGYGDLNAVKLD